MTDDDGERIPWAELQRRALIAGIDATQPRGVIESKLGIRSNKSVRTSEDDADEPTLVPDGGTTGEAGMYDDEFEVEGADPMYALARDDPGEALRKARKMVAVAVDELIEDDGTGYIPVFDNDEGKLVIRAGRDHVEVEQVFPPDGEGDEYRTEYATFERGDALLVSQCLRVLGMGGR